MHARMWPGRPVIQATRIGDAQFIRTKRPWRLISANPHFTGMARFVCKAGGHVRTGRELRVLSVYEGFFFGGARIVHSDIVLGLTEGGQHHRVLSLYGEVHREATRQRMTDDTCYRALTAAGVGVTSLDRTFHGTGVSADFTGPELAETARATAVADAAPSLMDPLFCLMSAP